MSYACLHSSYQRHHNSSADLGCRSVKAAHVVIVSVELPSEGPYGA